MKNFKLPLVKETIIIFKMALKTLQQEVLVYQQNWPKVQAATFDVFKLHWEKCSLDRVDVP